MAYKTTNPYTNEVEHEYPQASDADIEKALTAGYALYLKWRNGGELEERKQIITRLGQLLREKKHAMATLMTHDMG